MRFTVVRWNGISDKRLLRKNITVQTFNMAANEFDAKVDPTMK